MFNLNVASAIVQSLCIQIHVSSVNLTILQQHNNHLTNQLKPLFHFITFKISIAVQKKT